VSYLASALVDLAAHSRPDGDVDPAALEREVLERLDLPHPVTIRHRLPQFRELFASNTTFDDFYRSLWSDFLLADTWEMFEETGDVFDPQAAARLREINLGEGNSSDRNEAYRRFRGRDPDIRALMRDWGFPEGK
jgi:peptidyl-dipeptidase Dcp